MTTTVTAAPPSARVHGLDALRAAALTLGIVLHSLMPFVPGLPWLVTDERSSPLAGVVVFVIHLFRMVLFMLLAGYFGRMVLHRRGTGAYLRDRALRILLPLFAFWPVAVVPLVLLAVLDARLRGLPVPQPPADRPTHPLAAFDPGQLWFLAVLMQCVVVVVVVRALALRVLGHDRAGRWAARAGDVLSAPGGVLLAAVPYLVSLLLQGGPSGGIVQPTTLLPSLPPLTGYLGAFLVGWFLHARGAGAGAAQQHGAASPSAAAGVDSATGTAGTATPLATSERVRRSVDGTTRLGGQWPVHLGLAPLLSAAALLAGPAQVPVLAIHLLVALAGWTWVYGLVGLSARHLTRERAWVRYLADASYWAYLLHLPLLLAAEVVVAGLAWPVLVKLLFTWAVTAVVLLLSYDLLVRSTWLGRWLNGRRHPRVLARRRSPSGGSAAAEPGRRPPPVERSEGSRRRG